MHQCGSWLGKVASVCFNDGGAGKLSAAEVNGRIFDMLDFH